MTSIAKNTNVSSPNQLPMLKVFVADPYYTTNAVPSYICAIDITACLTKSGDVDLSDMTKTGFIHTMKLAFARGLDTSLDCLVHTDARKEIIDKAFFNEGSVDGISTKKAILHAIKRVATAINQKTNLYCNKLSFDVMQDGWLDESPFDLEFRVEWVDIT